MNTRKKKAPEHYAVLYARYSSDNQREESIDAQIRAIEKYASEKGYVIIRHYIDRAKSGTTDKRPEFQQMISDSHQYGYSTIICHKLDRFSRDRYQSAISKGILKKNGVKVLSVLENIDGSPESGIMEALFEAMAEYYSRNLSREIMKGMMENAYQSKFTGGTPPLGYDVNHETMKYVINEKEAESVKMIFDLYNQGYGYIQIVSVLNEKGYLTKKGKPFGKNSLYEILKNEKYAGVYVFNKTEARVSNQGRNYHNTKNEEDWIRIDGGVPPIVTKEEFEAAKAKMEKNKKRSGSFLAKEIYLLSGLIYCGECGHAFSGNSRGSGSKYTSYRCGKKVRSNQCKNKEVRKEYLENFVLDNLENFLFNEENIPALVKQLNQYMQSKKETDSTELIEMRKRLKDIDKKITNIVNAITNGCSESTFANKLKELEQQKSSIEFKMLEIEPNTPSVEITEDMLKTIFKSSKEFIKRKNIPECKKFIESYVDKVLVYSDRVEVTYKVASSFLSVKGFTITAKEKTAKLFKLYRKTVGL